MGILESIIRFTPFYESFKKAKTEKARKNQEDLERRYLPLRINFYKQFLHPGNLVFDIGANEGNRVLPFLECGAKVIAVEPQPVCVDILKQKFGTKITIENVGLSDSPGELEMLISSDTTVSSFSAEYVDKTRRRFAYSKWEGKITVPVTTLETIVEKHGIPRFCKIDVEGFELQVLKGLKKPLPLISIEYCVPELQPELHACLNYYHSLSPNSKFNYSIGETMEWALKDWKDFETFMEIVNSNEFVRSSFGDIYIKNDDDART